MVSPAGGGATVDGLCREAGVVTSDTVIERGGTADSGNPVTKIVVKIIIRNYRKLLKSKIRYSILIRAARAETHAETGKAAALNPRTQYPSISIRGRTIAYRTPACALCSRSASLRTATREGPSTCQMNLSRVQCPPCTPSWWSRRHGGESFSLLTIIRQSRARSSYELASTNLASKN